MSKLKSIRTDYRFLFAATIKQRFLSFTIGVAVFLLISSAAITLVIPNLKFQMPKFRNGEKGQIKGKQASTQKEVRTYVVQEGDQLSLIAEKFYGSGLNTEDIMKANNLTDSNLLVVGQTLIIPDVKPRYPKTGKITETAAKTEQVTAKDDTYVVREGDDLSKIALQAYGDSYAWQRIADANGLTNPDQLEVGRVLIIPR